MTFCLALDVQSVLSARAVLLQYGRKVYLENPISLELEVKQVPYSSFCGLHGHKIFRDLFQLLTSPCQKLDSSLHWNVFKDKRKKIAFCKYFGCFGIISHCCRV